MITLPKNWQTYHNSIIERSKRLIDHNIWQGLDKTTLNIWLKNFTDNDERFFSACLLDSLIYRSNSQIFSLMNDLLFKVINNKFYFSHPKGKQGLNFPDCLRSSNSNPNIRLVAVSNPSFDPTESSYGILRFFRKEFGIDSKWLIFPEKIKEALNNGVNTLVFVDDFLGTGNQFCKFCERIELSQFSNDTYMLYAPLVAHRAGIELITSKYHFMNICCAEYLSEKDMFFDNFFSDQINSINRSKVFYEELIQKKELMISEDSYYGYGGLELSYGFEYGAPDNTIPLLWYSGDGWKPLLKH